MAVALTTENLSKIHKYLKNAMRASRAAIYSANAGYEPKVGVYTVADLRTAIAGAASITDAAKALIDKVNDNVQ